MSRGYSLVVGARLLTVGAFVAERSGASRGGVSRGRGSSVAETSTRETKSWRIRFITPAGPEVLTLQALGPKQRDYRVFIDRL